jgi:hypothetical protein
LVANCARNRTAIRTRIRTRVEVLPATRHSTLNALFQGSGLRDHELQHVEAGHDKTEDADLRNAHKFEKARGRPSIQVRKEVGDGSNHRSNQAGGGSSLVNL